MADKGFESVTQRVSGMIATVILLDISDDILLGGGGIVICRHLLDISAATP